MADISDLLKTIATAVYGRDMRKALHDSIEKLNDVKAEKESGNGGFSGGREATSGAGGAVGQNTKATDGFSGGKDAQSTVDSIQLGAGTNKKEKTLQVYEYTLMDRDGTIPPERIKMATEGEVVKGFDRTHPLTPISLQHILKRFDEAKVSFGKLENAVCLSEFKNEHTTWYDFNGLKLNTPYFMYIDSKSFPDDVSESGKLFSSELMHNDEAKYVFSNIKTICLGCTYIFIIKSNPTRSEIPGEPYINGEIEVKRPEPVYTNTNPIIQLHGGIEVGETFENVPIADMLTKILYPYVAPIIKRCSIDSSGGVFEHGTIVTLKYVVYNIVQGSEKVTEARFSYKQLEDDVVFHTKTNPTVNKPNSKTEVETKEAVIADVRFLTDATVKFEIIDAKNRIVSKNVDTFTFVYPFYYGTIGASATASADAVKALTKLIQTKGTKTVTYTAANQKMVFAYPKSYGAIKTITDPNGFNVTNIFIKSEVNIMGLDSTEQAYFVYTSKPTTVMSFKMTFAY